MSGSTWAIAWYSCEHCGTFWYARLQVGPGSDSPFERTALPIVGGGSTPARVERDNWTLEELEAEADSLRRESDCLPKGDLEALRQHLEKLKVLADAINRRLDTHNTGDAHRAH